MWNMKAGAGGWPRRERESGEILELKNRLKDGLKIVGGLEKQWNDI